MAGTFDFQCPKCGSKEYLIGQLRASADSFSAYMNWDDVTMTRIVCKGCSFAELYDLHIEEFARKHGIDLRALQQ